MNYGQPRDRSLVGDSKNLENERPQIVSQVSALGGDLN
jgi:hypothetical protein